MKQHHPDILFLCETRIHGRQGIWILNKFHFTKFVVVETRGFADGLWCFWNDDKVEIKVWGYTTQMLTMGIMKCGRTQWLLSLVYASPVVAIRDTFCEYIEQLNQYVRFL